MLSFQEIKQVESKELLREVEKVKQELDQLVLQNSVGQLKETSKIRQNKHYLARLLTESNRRKNQNLNPK